MTTLTNIIRPDLRHFKPYSSARDEAKQGKIWLNANESSWDDLGEGFNRYPQKQPAFLLEKISALYGVEPTQLALLRGSDEAIDLVTRLVCRAGQDTIMIAPPTFGMYAICAELQGVEVIQIPLKKENDFRLDVEQLIAAWTPAVKLIHICTPNNPTGNSIPKTDILKLCDHFRGKSLIVVDEAYIEFSSQQQFPPTIQMATVQGFGTPSSQISAIADSRNGGVVRGGELRLSPLDRERGLVQATRSNQEAAPAVFGRELLSSEESMSHYIPQHDNLAVLRTFSKAYGLAGIRLGAILAQAELIHWINAILPPYPLPLPTIHVAMKIFQGDYLEKVQAHIAVVKQQRDYLMDHLKRSTWIKKIWPSDANFILVEATDAEKMMSMCMDKGIVLRNMHGKLGLENCIRIGIGKPEENQLLLNTLT